MEGQYNLRSPAVKRLMKEAQELGGPNEQFYAQPLEDNLFEWHFTIRGPVDSEFESGIYHGRIILPPEYPMKPPSIILLTPNGRFETNKKICLSISGHHPESWQPSWSLRTALLAIIGFMPTHGNGAIGSLDYTAEERKALATRSLKFTCPQCGLVEKILKPVTEASESLTQEAKALGAQINLQGEKEKGLETAPQSPAASANGPPGAPTFSAPPSDPSGPHGFHTTPSPPMAPPAGIYPPTDPAAHMFGIPPAFYPPPHLNPAFWMRPPMQPADGSPLSANSVPPYFNCFPHPPFYASPGFPGAPGFPATGFSPLGFPPGIFPVMGFPPAGFPGAEMTPGVAASMPGIPPHGVYVGLGPATGGIVASDIVSTDGAVGGVSVAYPVNSTAGGQPVYHWVHYLAPTMLSMSTAPDSTVQALSGLYATARMRSSTSTSMSEGLETRRQSSASSHEAARPGFPPCLAQPGGTGSPDPPGGDGTPSDSSAAEPDQLLVTAQTHSAAHTPPATTAAPSGPLSPLEGAIAPSQSLPDPLLSTPTDKPLPVTPSPPEGVSPAPVQVGGANSTTVDPHGKASPSSALSGATHSPIAPSTAASSTSDGLPNVPTATVPSTIVKTLVTVSVATGAGAGTGLRQRNAGGVPTPLVPSPAQQGTGVRLANQPAELPVRGAAVGAERIPGESVGGVVLSVAIVVLMTCILSLVLRRVFYLD